jgi:hypothetical protein
MKYLLFLLLYLQASIKNEEAEEIRQLLKEENITVLEPETLVIIITNLTSGF